MTRGYERRSRAAHNHVGSPAWTFDTIRRRWGANAAVGRPTTTWAAQGRHSTPDDNEGPPTPQQGGPMSMFDTTQRRGDTNTAVGLSRSKAECGAEGPTTQQGRAALPCPPFLSLIRFMYYLDTYPRRNPSLGTINLFITIFV